ncbi:uncharacterized protein LOC111629587 [Centruroides sculpturatus]|uniref:uncharacterized protein LOC111629587 n=1 Tax=Centruroides sculpturatus TaxID=218467 RepID=UPI000C6CDDBC|nr:uncharacterized protein LOC111629587 [Centruroides sculpturatus]
MANNHFKILQINAQKSQAASSLVIKTANDLEADIILIQEPYTKNNAIICFGQWQVLYKGKGEERPKSGVIIRNKNINAALIPDLSLTKITTVGIQNGPIEFVICIYFSPYEEDKSCVNELGSIFQALQFKKLLVAGDANAKSPIWHHEEEDERGRLIKDILNEYDLTSMNTSKLPTFFNGRAQGWTDICLAPTELSNIIINCETILKDSVSDHRYILTTLNYNHPQLDLGTNKYQKRTNWDQFRSLFASNWRRYNFVPLIDPCSIDNYVQHLTDSINSANILSSTLKPSNTYRTHWWTDRLENKK